MESNSVIEILVNGSNQDRYDLFIHATDDLLTVEVFSTICKLLDDKDDQTRFFAIFYLIDKFSALLSEANDELVNKIFNLIFDPSGPVIDRAMWALSIIGDKALDKLIQVYQTASIKEKIQITYAVGRGHFPHRAHERIALLLDSLKSDNANLRFSAMSNIMANTPISPWMVKPIRGIDYGEIYAQILPIALDFLKGENKRNADFAARYIKWIENS